MRPSSLVLAATFLLATLGSIAPCPAAEALRAQQLRCEYLSHPLGLEDPAPRLSWQLVSDTRGQRQTAYRILIASSPERLAHHEGDLWDSGKVAGATTLNVPYAGRPLASRTVCHWQVLVWDKDGQPGAWSEPAQWTMGLLQPGDWTAQWISFKDTSLLHTNRKSLYLPPARHYRKPFTADQAVRRATLYASALGIAEFHLNGRRVGDDYFAPGWSDYRKRAYYRTYDVTAQVQSGANALGAIVADGWYAGYVGYGLLVGYGPHKVGRYFYGKTPALLAQLELEYADGSRAVVGTDPTWEVSADGPFREADLIMGESFDARRENPGWCRPGPWDGPSDPGAWTWERAIPAAANGRTPALFSDNCGSREVDLGFQRPPRLQPYAAPPIRITQELPALRVTEPRPGVYLFDLGQNFAGLIRLRVQGPAGTKLQLRYGEMLHPDGRLMTENLRKARATDAYVLRGDAGGETWQPRFTYHGFQFVEVTGLPRRPGRETVTGLVLHNDTPLTGEFACSDPVLTRFWKNTQWTQRANFIEMPTDCPQRDERLGWMGDAQLYVRAASYNADVAAFFTKWLDDVEEAQRDSGAYPDYCPYPMGHGAPGQTWGTAWTDAGVICPWTVWQVYGDTRVLERHWASLTRFMQWRQQRAPDGRGRKDGNTWGDWLNLGETTPIEFIDAAYYKLDARLMEQMARALGRTADADAYRALEQRLARQFQETYLDATGRLTVPTQTAHVLALAFGLLPGTVTQPAADQLARMIATNGFRMATGFLGTKPLLPTLTEHGHHGLAVRLFQSRNFPSWGYEVVNGANSVWERWDSFTREHGFDGISGKNNAAMNSFSHYSFGAVTEWMFRHLAGIDTDGPGFGHIVLRPNPPPPGSNPDTPPIDWVKADYASIRGRMESHWRRSGDAFELQAALPANTQATLFLPARNAESIRVDGQPLAQAPGVTFLRMEADRAVLALEAGRYRFEAR